jgi:DNA-binding transcriptional LysR family regulator
MNTAAERAFPLLDIDLVRTFLAISETGSFSAAARRVFRTPSAVSMQMKRLEETLGRPLFVREGRSVRLSGDGEALLGYGRRLLQLNDEAVARFLGPPLEGLVRFGAPDDFGTRFLPDILARFARSHPHVDVDVVLGSSVDLDSQLEAGELDLALLTADASPSGTLQGQIVFSEPLMWVGLKCGMAAQKTPLALALSGRGCAWRGAALSALDLAGRPYRIAYTSEHCPGQLAAVLADLAIAPLPLSLAAAPLVALGEEHQLPLLGNYQIVLRQTKQLGAAASAFRNHAVESFGELRDRAR